MLSLGLIPLHLSDLLFLSLSYFMYISDTLYLAKRAFLIKKQHFHVNTYYLLYVVERRD
jgi:hypothetical protein